jgi:hypothetical protein
LAARFRDHDLACRVSFSQIAQRRADIGHRLQAVNNGGDPSLLDKVAQHHVAPNTAPPGSKCVTLRPTDSTMPAKSVHANLRRLDFSLNRRPFAPLTRSIWTHVDVSSQDLIATQWFEKWLSLNRRLLSHIGSLRTAAAVDINEIRDSVGNRVPSRASAS